jgi:hypothetical protein
MDQHSDAQAPQSYAFAFICQQGVLEGMALLLAASLKRFLRCQYELIAAIPLPESQWGRPHPTTLQTLQKMGVRIEYFENLLPLDRKGNPLTNKIFCFQMSTQMEKMVFLDSDLLCLQPFSPGDRFLKPFSAAPTFLATGRNWENIYAAVDLEVPEVRIPTLFSDDLQPPYFNSGFVAIDAALSADLSLTWWDCFHKIDESGAMSDNLYFREQVSLAIAVIKMGIPYELLDETYNYWVKFKPLEPERLPYFLHHTWPHPPVYHQPILNKLVRSLVQDYPEIRPFVSRCRWKYYLRPQWMVSIHQAAHQNRKSLTERFGKATVDFLIHGHL